MTEQPGPTGQGAGYGLRLEGTDTLYQYDAGGELRPVRACDVDVSRPFFSGPGNSDADFDQGDDPNLCASCGAGRHEQCVELADECSAQWRPCDCRDGSCGPAGEWQQLGYLTEPACFAGGMAYIAPVGTPAPSRTSFEGPIGPPIPVQHEERPDGSYVTGYLGAAHPAYDAVRAGLTVGLSVSFSSTGPLSDNESYVSLRHAAPADHSVSQTTSGRVVGSPAMNGLGREQIESHRAKDSVPKVTLPYWLGGPVESREPERVRLNRAERRRLLRQARRA